MSLREAAGQLDIDSMGLTPTDSARREQVVADVRRRRRRWLRSRLLYGLINDALGDLEVCGASGRAGVAELKLYKRLERRWFEAHCQRPGEDKASAGEDPLGAELAAAVRERLQVRLRERLADVRRQCGIGDDANVAELPRHVKARARFSETLSAEIERVRSQRRRALLSCLQLTEDLCGQLEELFNTQRRLLQPRFDLVSLKLYTEEILVLAAKLDKLFWEARSELFDSDQILESFQATKARLVDEEERWRKEVGDLERALTKYRIGEDTEYRNIVQQYSDCRTQLDNRSRVLHQLGAGNPDGDV